MSGIKVTLENVATHELGPAWKMVKIAFPVSEPKKEFFLSQSCAVWLATELLKRVQEISEPNFFDEAKKP